MREKPTPPPMREERRGVDLGPALAAAAFGLLVITLVMLVPT